MRIQTTNETIEGMQCLFDEHNMQLIEYGKPVKLCNIVKNLSLLVTDTIMQKATPDIDIDTKVIYNFKCEIKPSRSNIIVYSRA